jgi:hypothetical protein
MLCVDAQPPKPEATDQPVTWETLTRFEPKLLALVVKARRLDWTIRRRRWPATVTR